MIYYQGGGVNGLDKKREEDLSILVLIYKIFLDVK